MLEDIYRYANAMTLPARLRVPSHEELVHELQVLGSRYPERMSLRLDGRSRGGRALVCAEVGAGDRVVAVTAGAHADEPAGTVTCLHVVRNLLENSAFEGLLSGFKFLLHPMLDPDGAALNYRWASEAFSYRDYLLHNYRNNSPAEDCEHGIPVSPEQGLRPELAFFTRNVDRFRGSIAVYITLHTTHRTGGSIFAVSSHEDGSGRVRALTQLCERFGVPVMDLDLHGEKGIETIAPGFIVAPPMVKLAERFKDHPEIISQIKMPTYEYVQHHCGARFSLISELPSILDQILRANEETDVMLVDLKRVQLEGKRRHLATLSDVVEELAALGITEDNPWFARGRFAARFGPAGIQGEEKELPRYEGIRARQYEVNDVEVEELETELGLHRMVIQCLEGREDQAGLYEEHLGRFDAKYARLEALMDYRIIPLERQVRIQTAMILAGADL
jgi:hypothetical protein